MNSGSSGATLYPYAESTLTYKYKPQATIEWYTRYGLEESDVATSVYRKTFRTGFEIAHALGAKTNLATMVYYSYNEYSGPSAFSENVLEITLSATYQLTRKFSLNAGDTFTRDFSRMISRDYARNRIFGGLDYAF